ncbi:MAG: YtpR family tRNA-binding protein [Mycoplasma sp.]
MNIFYNKSNDNNSLISLVVTTERTKAIEKNGNYLFINENTQEIEGFNIFHVSHDSLKNNGRIFPSKEIITLIEKTFEVKNIKFETHFKIGEIIKCDPIENTHLSNCLVDIKSEQLNIVCGAKNARLGLKVVVATNNAYMPSGLIIRNSKLRGIDSFGMLCSQRELNITGFNDEGIIELNNDYIVGDEFNEIYKNI